MCCVLVVPCQPLAVPLTFSYTGDRPRPLPWAAGETVTGGGDCCRGGRGQTTHPGAQSPSLNAPAPPRSAHTGSPGLAAHHVQGSGSACRSPASHRRQDPGQRPGPRTAPRQRTAPGLPGARGAALLTGTTALRAAATGGRAGPAGLRSGQRDRPPESQRLPSASAGDQRTRAFCDACAGTSDS